ncbi:DNA-(apurinic or apyrimidinic site) lyase [Aphelenchoides fujianensis]|nr:DNA-(apurinic or apyrimidinic site) lyase [Aphelenchoides fujianensis]
MTTIDCSSEELNLDVVLVNGQSFRWRRIASTSAKSEAAVKIEEEATPSPSSSSTPLDPLPMLADVFEGVAFGRLWRVWRPNAKQIAFRVVARTRRTEGDENEDDAKVLKRYFQLDVDLPALYAAWSKADAHFRTTFEGDRHQLAGIRILRQEPVETVFAFICSANNNIARISKMVGKLAELYGEPLEFVDQKEADGGEFRAFPTVERLFAHVDGMEAALRAAGFGYRAAYVAATVRRLHELGGAAWLRSLAARPYAEARDALVAELPGVGPKVADCICLMALEKHEVVPVDTHVFQITAAHYLPELRKRKVAAKADMQQIGAFYVERFGSHAGWMHSVLFSTRLRQLKAETVDGTSGKPKATGKKSTIKVEIQATVEQSEEVAVEATSLRRSRRKRSLQ